MSRLVICLALALTAQLAAALAAADKPNVLVIFADDLGYADLSATGNQDLKTPNIDSLAQSGARFTNGYVTGCVCSPSRAALLTGRYQQRFGFDANAEGRDRRDAAPRALDIKQVTFAQRMKAAGYKTGLVGKWHQGAGEGYQPNDRGFDEFFGLLPHGIGKQDDPAPLFRNKEPAPTPPDHTVAFGQEAEAFIDRHSKEPFFLYLAFTAVHSPHIAPEKYLKQVEPLASPQRRRYLAMLACLDDAIGGVLKKLREHQLEENTLICFASDNGGPDSPAHNNGPYRGGKWSLWEGGIRSPLIVQWKGRIPAGRKVPHMAAQLDILPTALAAAGVAVESEWQLDGTNLLPLLEGKSQAPVHDALYWRFGVQYAARQGDWKILKASINSQPMLFNLATDPGEEHDLAAQEPERLKALQVLWDGWNAKNEQPRWIDERWNGLEEKAEVKKKRKAKKAAN